MAKARPIRNTPQPLKRPLRRHPGNPPQRHIEPLTSRRHICCIAIISVTARMNVATLETQGQNTLRECAYLRHRYLETDNCS